MSKTYKYTIEYVIIENGQDVHGYLDVVGFWSTQQFHRDVRREILELHPNRPIKGYFYRDYERVNTDD